MFKDVVVLKYLIQFDVVRTDTGGQGQAETLAQDMADLMHDFDVVSR